MRHHGIQHSSHVLDTRYRKAVAHCAHSEHFRNISRKDKQLFEILLVEEISAQLCQKNSNDNNDNYFFSALNVIKYRWTSCDSFPSSIFLFFFYNFGVEILCFNRFKSIYEFEKLKTDRLTNIRNECGTNPICWSCFYWLQWTRTHKNGQMLFFFSLFNKNWWNWCSCAVRGYKWL